MKEIQSIALVNMNNAAHFMFVSNMAGRAEKDATDSEGLAPLTHAMLYGKDNIAEVLKAAGAKG